MGTRSDLSEFWVILHHELTACRRDWRPIVLSWLFPVLVLGFGAALGGFTVGGELSHHFKVAVDDPDGKNQAFIQELKRYNHDIDITPSKNAAEDLRERKVEAAFSFSPDQKKVTVTMPVGGMSERLTQRMKNTVQAARYAALRKMLRDKGAPMRYAFPFDLDELPVAASASGLVEAVTLFGAMLMIRIGTSMSASLQAVWDEETRTHSLISLLLAPISRMSLICAKTITMILLGFARIAVDLLFFAGLIVVLMGVSLGASFANKNMANSANMANTLGLDKLQWGQFLLVCTSAFLIFGLLCAAVALIVLAICKRRNVNVTLGTTMTFISLPPLMVLAPGFQLDSTLQWIPVLNLAGIVKMGLAGTLPSTTAVIVILEMMTLASIAMGCAVYLIHREQFALNSLE